MNTESQYYYLDNGEVCGPVRARYIRVLIRKLILHEDVQVCPEGSQDWKPASEYEELKPTAPIAQPLPPGMGVGEWQGVAEPKSAAQYVAEAWKLSTPEPPVAAIVRGLAFVVAFGGLVGFCVGIENDSAAICFISLVSAGAWAVFVYSWSCALTWLYNIMLNSQKEAGKAEGVSEKKDG